MEFFLWFSFEINFSNFIFAYAVEKLVARTADGTRAGTGTMNYEL